MTSAPNTCVTVAGQSTNTADCSLTTTILIVVCSVLAFLLAVCVVLVMVLCVRRGRSRSSKPTLQVL